jgi:hypothetical protein
LTLSFFSNFIKILADGYKWNKIEENCTEAGKHWKKYILFEKVVNLGGTPHATLHTMLSDQDGGRG